MISGMEKLPISNLWLILTGLGLVGVGLFLDYHFPRAFAWEQNHQHTSAFHGGQVKDPLLPPTESETKQVSTPEFIFYSRVPITKRYVKIKFLYLCKPQCGQLWLSLKSKPDAVTPSFLLVHPVLDNLSWFNILEDRLFLYQKQINYQSIKDFVSQPVTVPVLTEYSVAQARGFTGAHVSFLEDTDQLGDAQYILTTYERPRYIGSWREFSRVLSIQGAERNQAGYLIWKLTTKPLEGQPLPSVLMTIPSIEYQ